MTNNASLDQLRAHLNRDGGIPEPQDMALAGLDCVDGCVSMIPTAADPVGTYLGPIEEFRIVGRAYDKSVGVLMTGRFLVQWSEIDGEVLRHRYK